MMSTMTFGWLAALITILMSVRTVQSQPAQVWNDQAYDTLKKAILREETLNTNTAKNVVFFVGSGMGLTTVVASRILRGQLDGMKGEETILAWENFSTMGMAKTYTTDRQVADGAGAATALFCGVKTKSGLVGVDDSAMLGDCKTGQAAAVDSVMISAEKAGKSTGFVTTARVTHATPSALYAHSPDRDWENDADIPQKEAAMGCTDIASQLITLGKNTKVILGGGRANMMPNTAADPEYPNQKGTRQDGRNLIDEWVSGKDPTTSEYVWKAEQFNAVDPKTTDYILGLFEPSHMQYSENGNNDGAGEPSIAQMVEKAIKILQKDGDGYFLMVEGGRIDHSHHDNNAYHALHDTVAMNEAVAKAIELTNENDTLVIVTADHSHTLSISGYPWRGNPILAKGFASGRLLMDDGLPYTTLAYAGGPGGIKERQSFEDTGMRRNLTNTDTEQPDFVQPALIPLATGSHGGEDVAIYANGPMSHLFHGVHEQNYIAHVVRYAARLGGNECGGNGAPSSGGFDLLLTLAGVMLCVAL
ncbi:alkaline phosphatase-like [Patiria miniata]|uniref:alkaline phosphatase n=1 Tax=Patiria miniata TaxID=46514 RepID=A0A914BI36_PATMI|nr:alkaline phosphatase-like [Patiria miniata]XP_038075943.1 alkaline phosphatase-like [Patiria miniata]